MNAVFKLDLSKINELQARSIVALFDKVSRAHNVDTTARKDAVDYAYQTDWLKHLELFCFDGAADADADNDKSQQACAKILRGLNCP